MESTAADAVAAPVDRRPQPATRDAAAKRQRHGSAKRPKSKPFTREWTMYAPPTMPGSSVPVPCSTFRVLSFNVLADYLAMKDGVEGSNREWKYKWEYRCSRLVREILHHRPHVVCLQEVDHFEDFFEPQLKRYGFIGVHKRRTGEETHDGCSVFVQHRMFRIVSSHPLEYKVDGHAVLDRDNVALHVVLESKQNAGAAPQRLIISNTHILFNPRRGEVKLAQIQRLLESLEALSQKHSVNDVPCPVLLSGDFNLQPHSPLYHLLSSGDLNVAGLSPYFLSGQHFENYRLQKMCYQNERDTTRHHCNGTAQGKFCNATALRTHHYFNDDAVAQYTHKLGFASAYAQNPDDKCTGEPKFTSFHQGFKGTVDYMWFTQASLHCHGVLEMIPAGILWKLKELPSAHLASDHIPLVADFSFRPLMP
ncbi:TPA: hypothetical protein N0F65_004735 [Lagenidium giganteum]|uniref:Endonuclease/exonuclease/phosphatase domain-containing protein n=1 Tax=Lagenidium giganteum TaxID=4803 RepID=A0AAV2YJ68_9STRA|nr:TPA: hypothetical protein N0F65_004735 [Lagenidium giganteum]